MERSSSSSFITMFDVASHHPNRTRSALVNTCFASKRVSVLPVAFDTSYSSGRRVSVAYRLAFGNDYST